MQTIYIAPTGTIAVNADIPLPYKVDQIISGVRLADSGAGTATANAAVTADAKGTGNSSGANAIKLQAGGLTAKHGTELTSAMSLVLVIAVEGEHVTPV